MAMFKPTEIVIDDVVPRLLGEYDRMFGDAEPAHRNVINHVGRQALEKISHSDALYHDVKHALNVTLVMQEALKGKQAIDGDVSPRDWTHMIVAALCFAIGFVRGAVPGDADGRYVVDVEGGTVTLAEGATCASLMPWVADRSMRFVRLRFADHPVLDAELLAEAIAGTRLPILSSTPIAAEGWPGLLRAAQILGMVADPNFMLKLVPLFLELKETGLHETLGFPDAAALRARYPELFWSAFAPHLDRATRYLRETEDGRQWLANMNAHLLTAERHASQ
jgi:hypothetical protein